MQFVGALTAVDTLDRAKLAALHMCVLGGATLVATFLEVGLFKWSGVLPVSRAVCLHACWRYADSDEQTPESEMHRHSVPANQAAAQCREACLGFQRKHACKEMVCTKLHPS